MAKSKIILFVLALSVFVIAASLASADYTNYYPSTSASYISAQPYPLASNSDSQIYPPMNSYGYYNNNEAYPLTDSYNNNYVAFPSFDTSSSGNYNSNGAYYNLNPVYNIQNDIANRQSSSNFDSSAYGSNYNGPSAKMDVQYSQLTDIRPSGRIIQTTNYLDNSIYLGASNSVNVNSQNRELTNSAATDNSQSNYNGGLSEGQSTASNSNQYSSNTPYWDNYYYAPTYSNGYYNWN